MRHAPGLRETDRRAQWAAKEGPQKHLDALGQSEPGQGYHLPIDWMKPQQSDPVSVSLSWRAHTLRSIAYSVMAIITSPWPSLSFRLRWHSLLNRKPPF